MSPGATFERVYLALRQALGSGRFRPGEHLEPSFLSQELNASITPVRDALHRLVGERLVEAPPSEGFRAPHVTEVGLRHLYAWSGKLLSLALTGPHALALPERFAAPASADPAAAIADAAGRLLMAIASAGANPEQVGAAARVLERLAPARRVEALIFPDMVEEVNGLHDLLARSDRDALRRALGAFHRRRIRAAHRIVAAMLMPC